MYDQNEQKRLQSYLSIHLKKDQLELSTGDKIDVLRKRDRAKMWHIIINVVAILFFGYSFYYDITELSQTFFYIIFAVFGVNVGLILYQKRQINELIAYLEWKREQV